MTRTILHIGYEKTATTYLQRLLHHNRGRLAPGVVYPDLQDGQPHHHGLWATGCTGDVDATEALMRAHAAQAETGSVLWSCELFSWQTKTADLSLRTCIEAAFRITREVELVASVREPFGFLESLYAEALRWGSTVPVNAFAASHLYRLETAPIVAIAAEMKARCTFLRYEPDRAVFLQRLLEALVPGLDGETLDPFPGGGGNVKFPPQALTVLLAMNRSFGNQALTDALVRLFDRNRKELSAPRSTGPFPDLLQIDLGLARQVAEICGGDDVRRHLFDLGLPKITLDGATGAIESGAGDHTDG